MARTVIYSLETGIIEHVCEAGDDHTPPEGFGASQSDHANINDKWNGGDFERHVPTETPTALSLATQAHYDFVSNRGFRMNVDPHGKPPLLVEVSTHAKGIAELTLMVALASADPSYTRVWAQSSGKITLNAAQIIAIGKEVAEFVQEAVHVSEDLLVRINASPPSVTMRKQVEQAPWPSRERGA